MTRGTQYIIFDQRLGKLRLGWIRLGYVRSNRSSGQKTSGQLNIWSKGLCGLSDTLANGTSDQRNPLVKKNLWSMELWSKYHWSTGLWSKDPLTRVPLTSGAFDQISIHQRFLFRGFFDQRFHWPEGPFDQSCFSPEVPNTLYLTKG